MAYTQHLKCCSERNAGSTPAPGTIMIVGSSQFASDQLADGGVAV